MMRHGYGAVLVAVLVVQLPALRLDAFTSAHRPPHPEDEAVPQSKEQSREQSMYCVDEELVPNRSEKLALIRMS